MLYPQNGGRIVAIDSVTSLHPMYSSKGAFEDLGHAIVTLNISTTDYWYKPACLPQEYPFPRRDPATNFFLRVTYTAAQSSCDNAVIGSMQCFMDDAVFARNGQNTRRDKNRILKVKVTQQGALILRVTRQRGAPERGGV